MIYGDVFYHLIDDVDVCSVQAVIEDAVQAGGRLVTLSTIRGPVQVLVTGSIPIMIRVADLGRRRRRLLV